MKWFPFFSRAKNHLTKIGENEPLSFLSILLIIGLDIFVLFTLFQGMDFQSSQLTEPEEVIPHECRRIIDIDPKREDYEKKLVTYVLDRNRSYYAANQNKYSAEIINTADDEVIDPKCRLIFDAALALRNDPVIQENFEAVEVLEKQRSELKDTIDQREEDYETMLLERIASQQAEESIIEGRADSVRLEVDRLNTSIGSIDAEVAKRFETIIASPLAQTYISTVDENKGAINNRWDYLQYWFPLKDILFKLLFLAPLLALFYWVYKRSIAKNRELLILVSAHMLIVTTIPIIIYVIDFFIDVLPFHFLADLLELLEALNLIVIWSYLLILLGIGATLALIYLIQKRFFSRERLQLKRIANHQCHACGTRIDSAHQFCFKCGQEQLTPCPACRKETFVRGRHCVHCGNIQNLNKQE